MNNLKKSPFIFLTLFAFSLFAEEDLSALFETAKKQYNMLDIDPAIETLTKIIETPELKKDAISDADAKLLASALELRGVCFYNLGRIDETKEDFSRLVDVAPAHKFDEYLPSKANALFEEIRRSKTCRLTVTTEPEGAQIFAGDLRIGASPLHERPIPLTTQTVRIEKTGYKSVEEGIDATAGGVVRLDIKLAPTHRSAAFWTLPTDVEVWIDDQFTGKTQGRAGADASVIAKERGLNPDDLSMPFETPPLAEGTHSARFEKPCYKPIVLEIDIRIDDAKNPPVIFEPVVLSKSVAALEIRSEPSGLETYIDGKPLGTTPLRAEGVCAGERTLKVGKKETGEWFEKILLEQDETFSLTVSPRPTAAFLGVFDADNFAMDKEKFRSLVENFKKNSGREKYNILVPTKEFGGASVDEIFFSADKDLGADIYILAVDRGTSTEFFASAVSGVKEDAFSTEESLFKYISSFYGVFRPSLGFDIVDISFAEGVLIYSVAESAENANIKEGKIIKIIDGKPVKTAEDFRRTVEELSPGREIVIKFSDGSEGSVKVKSTPALVSFGDAEKNFHKRTADWRFIVKSSDDPIERSTALLNIGAILYAAGRYAEAEEALTAANFLQRAGIGEGTKHYLLALVYIKQSEFARALDALNFAVQNPSATLDDDCGPSVAPFAERLKKQIQ